MLQALNNHEIKQIYNKLIYFILFHLSIFINQLFDYMEIIFTIIRCLFLSYDIFQILHCFTFAN